jgi:hypothetical protein
MHLTAFTRPARILAPLTTTGAVLPIGLPVGICSRTATG